jgi:tetratricopeptide (TPR) repeat protein
MERSLAAGLPFVLLLSLAVWAGLPSPAAHAQRQISDTEAPRSEIVMTPELRGDIAMAREQYLAAIEAYREAPQNSPAIWNKLGMAYHHLFAMDQAKRAYERALRLQPDFPEALNNLGAVYYAHHSYGKAEKLYEKAIRLGTTEASIFSNLGTAYFAQGKVKPGIAAYQAAYRLDPRIFADSSPSLVSEALPARSRAEQDFCIAELFAQAGRNSDAIRFLRKALDEGFANHKKILQDQMLASLRTTPEFGQLMAEQKLR